MARRRPSSGVGRRGESVVGVGFGGVVELIWVGLGVEVPLMRRVGDEFDMTLFESDVFGEGGHNSAVHGGSGTLFYP